MHKVYILRHDTPEIKMGAILDYNCDRGRYEVMNLDEVARYELTPRSQFTFHKDVVEKEGYWFELLDDCDCNCHLD